MQFCLGIFDLEQSKKNFKRLSSYLNMAEFQLFTELDEEETMNFKALFFVLNPQSIGNESFLMKIKSLLERRKNTQTYYFLIDSLHDLEKREKMKVEVELEAALSGSIRSPMMMWVDSRYAALYSDFQKKKIVLSDIQKDKKIRLTDKEGYQISGQAITEEDVKQLWELSNIENVIQCLSTQKEKLRDVNIEKRRWSAAGNPSCGKSMFQTVMEHMDDSIEILELNDWKEYKNHSVEGLILLLDDRHTENKKLLEEVASQVLELPLYIVLNKTDSYMNTGEDKKTFCETVRQYTRKITGIELLGCISSLYVMSWMDYKDKKMTAKELAGREEIVLLDEFDFPLFLVNEDEFIKVFKTQNYEKEMQGVQEKLCLKIL